MAPTSAAVAPEASSGRGPASCHCARRTGRSPAAPIPGVRWWCGQVRDRSSPQASRETGAGPAPSRRDRRDVRDSRRDPPHRRQACSRHIAARFRARQARPACARDRSAAKPSRLEDRLAGAFPVRNEGGQTLVGQRMLVECRQHLWRQGDDIGAEKGGVDDMLRSADRGDENLRRKIILVVDGADLLDQPHAVLPDVVEASDEG